MSSKSLNGKKGGIIAYTQDKEVFIVLQNVFTWSFPKGHFETRLDESILDTAIREFKEETEYKGDIDPSRLVHKMKPLPDTTLFLLEMTPEEVKNIKLIDAQSKHNEVLQSGWVNILDLEYFKNTYPVNKTISNFNINRFIELSSTNTFSFRKSRKTSRKSRKASRKSRKTSRKSRKASRKSRKASRKSRKASRKSRKTSRKSI